LPQTWTSDMRPVQQAHECLGWLAVLLAVWFVVARWRVEKQRWLLGATPLALLPSLPGLTESRLLFPCLLGWSVLVAQALSDWVEIARRGSSRRQHAGCALFLGLCLVSEAVGQVVYHLPAIVGMPVMAGAVRRSLLARELDEPLRTAKRVLLLGAADLTTTIYFPLVRRAYGRTAPASYQLLSSYGGRQRLERLTANGFSLERLDRRASPFDGYAAVFNREPFQSGQRFNAGPLQVMVERAFEGRPMRTLYQLDVPLEPPDVLLFKQTAQGLEPVAFPPVGGHLVIDPPVPPVDLADAQSARDRVP
jgi:hypothetical protein